MTVNREGVIVLAAVLTIEPMPMIINDIEDRVDRIENRVGDIRERLAGIEVHQKEHSKTMERISKAVER